MSGPHTRSLTAQTAQRRTQQSLSAAARSLDYVLRPALISICLVEEPAAGKTATVHAGRMLSLDGGWPPVATASLPTP